LVHQEEIIDIFIQLLAVNVHNPLMPPIAFSGGFAELRPRAAKRENHTKQQTAKNNYLFHRLFLTEDRHSGLNHPLSPC